MNYFTNGLTASELKAEYKKLAKKYHPDVGGSEEIMKTINTQFDEYFDNIFGEVEKEIVSLARGVALFMSKNKNSSGVIGIERKTYQFGFFQTRAYNEFYYPTKWKDAHEGFALCKVIDGDDLSTKTDNSFTVTGKNYPSTCLLLPDLAEHLLKRFTTSFFSMYRSNIEQAFYTTPITHYTTPYGDFDQIGMEHKQSKQIDIICMVDDTLVDKSFYFDNFPDKQILESYVCADIPFLAYQNCTYEEFTKEHDVNWKSRYFEALQLMPIDSDVYIHSTSLASNLWRHEVIEVYYSKLDFSLKCGTFNLDKLIPYLKRLDIDDIEEVQEYLDQINGDFDKRVKGKIKKGKLQIII